MEIIAVDSTDRFIGTDERPRQVVRLRLRGTSVDAGNARVSVSGRQVRSEEPVSVARHQPSRRGNAVLSPRSAAIT